MRFPALLATACLTFIICLVRLGYRLSTFVKTQKLATQIIMFDFLPSRPLSGFMLAFRGLPAPSWLLSSSYKPLSAVALVQFRRTLG